MNKQQFLNELRQYLEGEVSYQILNENIDYYDHYFDEQKSMGKTEAEIAQELGKPSLIARTIIDASGVEQSAYYEEQVYTENGEVDQEEESGMHVIEVKWYHKLIFAIVLILIIALLVTVTGAVVSFLAPVILVLLIIALIRRLLS
ncbi:MAG: DUF1700 domain-containing protein [Lachnospiraceae bacterium]|nr:DUF1700 domain-containing protein [Lachnospiraceae bacterium]